MFLQLQVIHNFTSKQIIFKFNLCLIYITENLNIHHNKWVKIGINNYSNAKSIEKLRIIIFKIHQTTIWNEKYCTLKIIDFNDKNFEDNTKKFENNLNHASMLIHNLIQDVKYLNLNVNNLILFFYTHDSLKLFSHQIMSVSIMLKLK